MRASLFSDVARRILVLTDISGQPICRISKGQAFQEKFFLDCLTLEDGTNRSSRNVGNYQPTLRNIQEKRRSRISCRPNSATLPVPEGSAGLFTLMSHWHLATISSFSQFWFTESTRSNDVTVTRLITKWVTADKSRRCDKGTAADGADWGCDKVRKANNWRHNTKKLAIQI